MKIDSHHHIWDLEIHPQEWMGGPNYDVVRKNFLMKEFREHSAGCAIDKTVLVQTVMNYKETPDYLDVADKDPLVAGVVGFIKMDAEDAIKHLDGYQSCAGFEKLVGIRDMAHFYSDPNYLAKPQVIKNCQELGRRGIAYDLLTKTPEMTAALALIKECPDTTFVVDHISKPLIAAQVFEPWTSLIKEIASFPNVYCKVSGMVTEADWENWKVLDFKPYVETIIESFGPKRMMFGSDWPVALLASTYKGVVELAEELTRAFSQSEKDEFWAGSAIRAYSLKI